MFRTIPMLFVVIILFFVVASGAQEAPLTIAASIPPLCDFVKQVGGERVEVIQLVPNGFNPHAYEPTPRDVQKMAQAKVVFLVGLGFDTVFEKLLQGVDETKPVVLVGEGLEILSEEEDGKVFPDPHVWVSLRNAQQIVDTITRSLSTLDPERKAWYEERASGYKKKLQQLDAWFVTEIEKMQNRSFVASHNAWSYMARDYGLLLQGVIEKAPEREPTPQELRELIETMNNEGVRVVFAEPQFNQKIAQVLAQETKSTIIELDPLGVFPDTPYLELMQRNFMQILKGLSANTKTESY
ncbi:MAG: metal ABC transporter substrate-binding protein [Atribacterota bacterium]